VACAAARACFRFLHLPGRFLCGNLRCASRRPRFGPPCRCGGARVRRTPCMLNLKCTLQSRINVKMNIDLSVLRRRASGVRPFGRSLGARCTPPGWWFALRRVFAAARTHFGHTCAANPCRSLIYGEHLRFLGVIKRPVSLRLVRRVYAHLGGVLEHRASQFHSQRIRGWRVPYAVHCDET